VARGYVDTLRIFTQEPGLYTWWDYKTRARERNVGWRIDYFFVNAEFEHNVTRAFIRPELEGSDHCPIGIEVKL
jgi:exodeoxyribonuclease-3